MADLQLCNLVKRFGVSLSIVNEALGRLSHDGLVETKEMYGTRVISLSTETLRDEFVLREAIERHVVRLLAEHAHADVLEELLAEAAKLDRCMNLAVTRRAPRSCTSSSTSNWLAPRVTRRSKTP